MSKKEKIFRTTKEVLKTAKRRKSSSTRWLQRQINDPYVRQAQAEGKRSRAAYKIIQIDERYKIFNLGDSVLDLGAAPGSWSQYASKVVKSGKIISRVALLTGCVQRVISPEINESTIRILNRHNVEVVVMPEIECCGSLNHHLGKNDIANKVFIKLIDYPYEEYIQQSSDKLISDIANKVTAVIFSVIFPTLLFLSTVIQIFGIIVLLLFVNSLLVSYLTLFFLIFYW